MAHHFTPEAQRTIASLGDLEKTLVQNFEDAVRELARHDDSQLWAAKRQRDELLDDYTEAKGLLMMFIAELTT